MKRKVSKACAACHREPHQGRFGRSCQDCHTWIDWRLKAGAAFDHALTKFPLRGRHGRVDCAKCHPAEGSYSERFTQKTHRSCRDCHSDPHGGPFASIENGDRCDACHRVEGFSPARSLA